MCACLHVCAHESHCSNYMRSRALQNYQSEGVGALECDWVQEMDSRLMSTNKKVGVAYY